MAWKVQDRLSGLNKKFNGYLKKYKRKAKKKVEKEK